MTAITHIADYLPLIINVELGLVSSHFTVCDGTSKGLDLTPERHNIRWACNPGILSLNLPVMLTT